MRKCLRMLMWTCACSSGAQTAPNRIRTSQLTLITTLTAGVPGVAARHVGPAHRAAT